MIGDNEWLWVSLTRTQILPVCFLAQFWENNIDCEPGFEGFGSNNVGQCVLLAWIAFQIWYMQNQYVQYRHRIYIWNIYIYILHNIYIYILHNDMYIYIQCILYMYIQYIIFLNTIIYIYIYNIYHIHSDRAWDWSAISYFSMFLPVSVHFPRDQAIVRRCVVSHEMWKTLPVAGRQSSGRTFQLGFVARVQVLDMWGFVGIPQ